MTDPFYIIDEDEPDVIEILDDTGIDVIEIVEAGIIPGPQGAAGLPGTTGGTARNTTKLSITGSKVAGSLYSVTSSGVNYVKSMDDGDLLDETSFNGTAGMLVFLNGVSQGKGNHAIWDSRYGFTLDLAVDNGDELLILS